MAGAESGDESGELLDTRQELNLLARSDPGSVIAVGKQHLLTISSTRVGKFNDQHHNLPLIRHGITLFIGSIRVNLLR
ncbi:hypothetical protein RRG08_063224 [Elysia crispata]|uniref:Uncharacterized protein n=1 Tax=Elysia crispata TaxID=231223 RepID=A0AAE0Y9X1_9GAST|nr:hypothetical protein RRG08_063224 [Elysia crispata]